MMYEIYEGAIGQPRKVIASGAGDWVAAVKAQGYTPDKYFRMLEFEDGTHIDFGSWSVFVRIYPGEK